MRERCAHPEGNHSDTENKEAVSAVLDWEESISWADNKINKRTNAEIHYTHARPRWEARRTTYESAYSAEEHEKSHYIR
jgi:hypothetical protein